MCKMKKTLGIYKNSLSLKMNAYSLQIMN